MLSLISPPHVPFCTLYTDAHKRQKTNSTTQLSSSSNNKRIKCIEKEEEKKEEEKQEKKEENNEGDQHSSIEHYTAKATFIPFLSSGVCCIFGKAKRGNVRERKKKLRGDEEDEELVASKLEKLQWFEVSESVRGYD